MRIQEINMQIALQRERREGVLGAIKTMNDVYARMAADAGQGGAEDMAQSPMPQMAQPM